MSELLAPFALFTIGFVLWLGIYSSKGLWWLPRSMYVTAALVFGVSANLTGDFHKGVAAYVAFTVAAICSAFIMAIRWRYKM